MEQQTPLLSVSFLPTKQDYADYQIAACNAAASPSEQLFLRAAGFVLVVAGFVLCLLFGVGNPQNTVFFSLLVLLGLAVGFFHDSIQPLLVRSRAQSFYDHAGERMTAQSLSFFADHVDVKSDRYAASLPYAMLSVWEDGRILLLRLGPGESRYVPKRALSPEDVQKLHALFPTGGQTQK